jgi:hypothetical protein
MRRTGPRRAGQSIGASGWSGQQRAAAPEQDTQGAGDRKTTNSCNYPLHAIHLALSSPVVGR